MNLRDSESEARLRADVKAWLAETLPTLPPTPGPEDWQARREFDLAWQRRLYDAGYGALNWPKEYGGRGATPAEQLVVLEELALAGAPYVGMNFVGLLHAGPTILAEGNDEQKARYLPPILRGEEVWCQGFSEPSAGSDLASLRTRAVRDGDVYVVTGQKTWSSFAHGADWCELLVRTNPDAPKHRGISWLIMPMDAPGIEVRPLQTIRGSTEFAEVFLDEVRIPVANRVGAENDGWRVAMVTFSFERGTAFVGELVDSRRRVGDVAALARAAGMWDDAGVRRAVGHLVAEFDGLWELARRNVSQAGRTGVPGIGGSVLKLRYSEARQQLDKLAMELLGRAALALDDVDGLASGRFVEDRLRNIAMTIAAGTSQVQRNIIAERILGLPKEPQWTSS